MASCGACPAAFSISMRSIIMMALFTMMPERMMSPMSTITLMDIPVASPMITTPMMPSGMVNMMMKGFTKDSNWDAMTRYTRNTARKMAKIMDEKATSCSML